MCLIILANDIKSLSMDDMKTAYTRNPHGFGVMYMDHKKNFVSDKFVPKNFNEVKNFFNLHKEKTNVMAIHFRFKTEGKTNKKNCHPFISFNKDNRTIGMMHNGPKLPIELKHDNCSDTWHYNHYLLKPKFEKNPNKVLENSFQKAISEHIDNDKMVFLDSKSEKFIIINENLGNYKGKNWFSNTYWEIPKPNFNLNLYGSNHNYNSFDYDYVSTPTEKEIKKMTYMDIEMFVDHCFTHYDTVPIIELISKYQRKILSRK